MPRRPAIGVPGLDPELANVWGAILDRVSELARENPSLLAALGRLREDVVNVQGVISDPEVDGALDWIEREGREQDEIRLRLFPDSARPAEVQRVALWKWNRKEFSTAVRERILYTLSPRPTDEEKRELGRRWEARGEKPVPMADRRGTLEGRFNSRVVSQYVSNFRRRSKSRRGRGCNKANDNSACCSPVVGGPELPIRKKQPPTPPQPARPCDPREPEPGVRQPDYLPDLMSWTDVEHSVTRSPTPPERVDASTQTIDFLDPRLTTVLLGRPENVAAFFAGFRPEDMVWTHIGAWDALGIPPGANVSDSDGE